MLKPRRMAPNAPTVCTSLQTLSQRRQKMHLSILRTIEAVISRLRGGQLTTIERHFANIETQCQRLKFAVTAFRASETVIRMVGKNQFGYHFTGVHYAQGTGFYHHALRATGSAGRSQVASSHHFNHTNTAGSRIIFYASSFQVDMTQRRYIDTDFDGGFKNGASLGHSDEMTVYLESNLFFFHSK